METEVEGTPVRILFSSPSSNSPSPSDFKTIFEQALANRGGTTTVFELAAKNDNRSLRGIYSLTVALNQEDGESSTSFLEDALERCENFVKNASGNFESSMTVLLARKSHAAGVDGTVPPSAHLIILHRLEKVKDNFSPPEEEDTKNRKNIPFNIDAAGRTSSNMFWRNWRLQWPKTHTYESLPGTSLPSKSPYRRRLVIPSIALAFFLLVSLLSIAVLRWNRDSTYIRYDTSGSSGPRHQLRVYWQNASEWARANPQDSGKWKVRIDDQAIIPADLYDEDEDRYQQWYRNRYPEAQQVVENLNYVRPAWLGSKDIMVPWDSQFHFAHCVLALRRYWKAKESGRHVCGRDIDHAHINHCLGSLEKRIFIDGPRVEMDPPQFLYWQTRVCF
jgi:hypothetical protein